MHGTNDIVITTGCQVFSKPTGRKQPRFENRIRGLSDQFYEATNVGRINVADTDRVLVGYGHEFGELLRTGFDLRTIEFLTDSADRRRR